MEDKEPVSSQDVYQALCGAASQDSATLQASTKLLQQYQARPGTYGHLYAIAAEKNTVPLDVRRMAIIQFKNGALGAWKSKRQIADFNAHIMAKPSLVPDLIAIVQTQTQVFLSNPTGADPANTLHFKRALRVLHLVVKEFCSVKMPAGIRIMTQIAESLYSPLIQHYDRLSSLLQASFTVNALLDPHLQNTCEEAVTLSHMVFKPCTKIMLWLWQKAGQPQYSAALETLAAFSKSCFQLARILWDLRFQLIASLYQEIPGGTSPSVRALDTLTRHLRLYGKMFLRMQQLSSQRFVALPHANELILYYWAEVIKASNGPPGMISDSPNAFYPVRLLVQCMILFRESLNAWSGKKTENMTATRAGVLSEHFVEDAVRLLLTRLIPLSSPDLERWTDDPEEWVNHEEKEGDAWEYELRPCGERVLISLSLHYGLYVVPILMKTFQQILVTPTDNLTKILQKEAMYCAIGRCASRLHNVLDFDEWLQKYLVSEAQESNPDYRIIKRRIAWVIGKWHAIQSTPCSKTQVWEILLHLMRDHGPSSDAVVRLSASEALRECIDVGGFCILRLFAMSLSIPTQTVAFDEQTFHPFLGDFVTQLVLLISEAGTLEAKNRLTKSLNTIVPFTEIIVNPLPQLWQDAGEDYLLKATLIVMVTRLVEATREHSGVISHIVISLVQESLTTKEKHYLDEDGLLLWAAAIRNALTLESTRNGVPGYIDMFSHVTLQVSGNMDALGTMLSIVESYVVLDAKRVLATHARELFQAFALVLPRAVQMNTKNIILVLGLITQITPPEFWAEPMHSSGLFAVLAKAVIDDKESALVLTEHIYVFARIALSDPFVFNQLVAGAAPALNMLETQVFEGVLDQWWSKFDNMAEPRHRKLAAMGIASWVSSARPEVLGRLHTEIFNIWLDVFGELKEALADESTDGTRLVSLSSDI
ncbi:armadillo-type protein [Gautieria morchelliformis]|nr:armadillo-type protein [Gautieria morchelliformis]